MRTMMASITDKYFHALSSLDRAAYLACFAEDAEVLDPYGVQPYEGRPGLEKFFDNMEKTWAAFAMTPKDGYAAGNRIAVPWSAQAAAKSGKTAEFAGVNVFTLNEDDLITRLEGYWDFKAMVAQIK